MGLYLKIKAITWVRDSHGLFDYDSSNTIQEVIKVVESGDIVRKGTEISFYNESFSSSEGVILNINEKFNEFVLNMMKDEPAGLVIRELKSSQNKGFRLAAGDRLKIGKVVMNILETHETIKVMKQDYDECEGSNLEDICCRICFRTHTNKIDPLLSLCDCLGSLALTHFFCLQKWVISKCIKKLNSHTLTYCWKTIDCEICKKPIPLKFAYEGFDYSLIDIPRPQGLYMILEDTRNDKFKHIIHVLTPDIAPLSLGRSSECDLKINDISVSRSHATIEVFNNKFYIKDNFSKFGTLILVNKPVNLRANDNLAIQISRTVLYVSVKKKSTFCECLKCCKNRVAQEPILRRRTEIPWEEQSLQSPHSQFDN
ncbi:hypothetical protein SteCoe_589 [Stentor coeruleus]|uniref:RING-CH-type domain-containing protein n=1 Tax=Stentor coeruleus TaxID=5963 RepID=A0A1R2D3M5_9CILI|nr:hypothetical protein SteCoe_589 [Stentor coeruleus]